MNALSQTSVTHVTDIEIRFVDRIIGIVYEVQKSTKTNDNDYRTNIRLLLQFFPKKKTGFKTV